MSEDELASRLQQLGLNLYESRAYLALLGETQLSAKGLGQAAKIPQSRTYDVLHSLATKGFAIATPSSPRAYTSVPADKVLPAYYRAKRKELQTQVTRVHEEAQVKLDTLHEAYIRVMDNLKEVEKRDPRFPEPVWVVEGRDSIENVIVSLVQGAKKELLRITGPPDLRGNSPFDPFYIIGMEHRKFVDDARDRGVKIRWLSLVTEIPSYIGLDVEKSRERRYIEHVESITEKFFISDGDTVVLNLRGPGSAASGTVALMVRSEIACSVFREHFEALWQKAKPLADVLLTMRELVDQVCAKMKELGLKRADIVLYRTLARTGATTEEQLKVEALRKRISEEEASESLGRLLQKRLVHKNNSLKFLMVEAPAKVLAALDGGAVP